MSIQSSADKFAPVGEVDNKTALFQVMAWRLIRRQAITWTKVDQDWWRLMALSMS